MVLTVVNPGSWSALPRVVSKWPGRRLLVMVEGGRRLRWGVVDVRIGLLRVVVVARSRYLREATTVLLSPVLGFGRREHSRVAYQRAFS